MSRKMLVQEPDRRHRIDWLGIKCIVDRYRDDPDIYPEERNFLRSYKLWDEKNQRLDERAVEKLYMELR